MRERMIGTTDNMVRRPTPMTMITGGLRNIVALKLKKTSGKNIVKKARTGRVRVTYQGTPVAENSFPKTINLVAELHSGCEPKLLACAQM